MLAQEMLRLQERYSAMSTLCGEVVEKLRLLKLAKTEHMLSCRVCCSKLKDDAMVVSVVCGHIICTGCMKEFVKGGHKCPGCNVYHAESEWIKAHLS